MTIASEITRLQGAKNSIKTAINNTGLIVDDNDKIDEYYKYIEQLTYIKPPRTFTVSWEELQSPNSWTNTYSDDATGLSQGSTDFDEFFGYSYAIVDGNGNEIAEVTQKDSGGNGKLDISLLQQKGIIDGSSGSLNNVMIKLPRRGIKMSKSGSTVTMSITNEPNKSGFQYYAFNENGEAKDYIYVGAFRGSKDGSNRLRSISGASVVTNFDRDGVISAANAMGAKFHEITWYIRQLIVAYYKMKYANPNSQSIIGRGGTGNTGATNSITDATGASSGRVKLFGIEDAWGNGGEHLDGCEPRYYTLYTSSTQAFRGSSYINSFDKEIGISGANYTMSAISGSNDGMFATTSYTGLSGAVYYTDMFTVGYTDVGQWNCVAGSYWASPGGAKDGIFCVATPSYGQTKRGSRLICFG